MTIVPWRSRTPTRWSAMPSSCWGAGGSSGSAPGGGGGRWFPRPGKGGRAGPARGVAGGAPLGVKGPAPLTTQAGSSDYGLAGVRVFALANLTTERPSLPGLAFRLDASLPWGALAGSGAAAMVQALATRSFGRNRVHLNAGAALASPDRTGEAQASPRARASGALDRTLLRSSTLLLLAFTAEQETRGRGVEIAGAVGCRRQVTPTLVLDAGISYAVVRDSRPIAGITLGLSHAFGIAALLPGGG